MLTNLAGILEKAAADAEARRIDPSVFVQARLFPDMFPFARQIQITSDMAKGAPLGWQGLNHQSMKTMKQPFPELKARRPLIASALSATVQCRALPIGMR